MEVVDAYNLPGSSRSAGRHSNVGNSEFAYEVTEGYVIAVFSSISNNGSARIQYTAASSRAEVENNTARWFDVIQQDKNQGEGEQFQIAPIFLRVRANAGISWEVEFVRGN